MITLILAAQDIPDRTEVRKPTGSKLYMLRHKLTIYGLDQEVNVDPSIMFLIADGGVNAIVNDTKLAIDLELEEAIDFLRVMADGR